VREIAELALECLELPPGGTRFTFSGGDRGWKGDVPVVRLDTTRIRALGWAHTMSSREALRASMLAMLPDAAAGRLWR
jgi:UDP-glucose 4-epimerase